MCIFWYDFQYAMCHFTTKLLYNSHSVKVFSDILYLLYLSVSIGKHDTEALFSMFNRYIRYRKELDKICSNLIFFCEKNLGPGVPRVYIVDQTHRLSFCIHPAFITSHIKHSLSNKKKSPRRRSIFVGT